MRSYPLREIDKEVLRQLVKGLIVRVELDRDEAAEHFYFRFRRSITKHQINKHIRTSLDKRNVYAWLSQNWKRDKLGDDEKANAYVISYSEVLELRRGVEQEVQDVAALIAKLLEDEGKAIPQTRGSIVTMLENAGVGVVAGIVAPLVKAYVEERITSEQLIEALGDIPACTIAKVEAIMFVAGGLRPKCAEEVTDATSKNRPVESME